MCSPYPLFRRCENPRAFVTVRRNALLFPSSSIFLEHRRLFTCFSRKRSFSLTGELSPSCRADVFSLLAYSQDLLHKGEEPDETSTLPVLTPVDNVFHCDDTIPLSTNWFLVIECSPQAKGALFGPYLSYLRIGASINSMVR